MNKSLVSAPLWKQRTAIVDASTQVQREPGLIATAVFLVAHLFLGVALYLSDELATLHALATIGIGVLWALIGNKPERIACVAAYIAGAEVLWRMTSANIFYESGKYAIVLVFGVAMLRQRQFKWHFLPILYFLLLVPSVVLTILNLSLSEARTVLSFNLSGPLALAVCASFFSYFAVTHHGRRQVFLALIGSAVSIAAATLFATMTTPDLVFTGDSNPVTSGGFGPNQVSSVLGLGAFVTFFYLLQSRGSRAFKTLLLATMVLLITQSAMTFSRGGLVGAVGALVPAIPFLLKDKGARLKLVGLAILLSIVAIFIVLPRLNAFTGGALEARFRDTNTTHRDRLARADIELWQEHPLFGVGPGRSGDMRNLDMRGLSAHTELTRLLAEHGTLGLGALLALLLMGVQSIRLAPASLDRGFTIALVSWALLYMLHAAMRLAAPAFIFGLAMANLEEQQKIVQPSRTLPYSTRISHFHNIH